MQTTTGWVPCHCALSMVAWLLLLDGKTRERHQLQLIVCCEAVSTSGYCLYGCNTTSVLCMANVSRLSKHRQPCATNAGFCLKGASNAAVSVLEAARGWWLPNVRPSLRLLLSTVAAALTAACSGCTHLTSSKRGNAVGPAKRLCCLCSKKASSNQQGCHY